MPVTEATFTECYLPDIQMDFFKDMCTL